MTDTNLNPGAGPEQARTLERTANVKTQVVALDVGGAEGPEKLVDEANRLPVADATLADLQTSIQALNDTMLYMLSAMLEKMPRLDGADRMVARVVLNGENDMSNAYGGIHTNATGDPNTGRSIYRMFEPWNFSDAGSARIYQQIQVTA